MINISKLSEGNPCLKHGEHTLRDPVRRINLSKERGRRTARVRLFSYWEEWLNLLLELWLTVSPWVLGFTHTKAMHVSIGLGAMVAFVAGLELWLVKYDPQYSSG
jgi:hypothetical protein